jgi:hypothetical protein
MRIERPPVFCLVGLLTLAAAVNCGAQPTPAVSADPKGATAADKAAPQLSSGDPVVNAILDRLEAKGKAIKGLSCRLVYTFVTVEPVEDKTIKKGALLFARGDPNSKFLIRFTELIAAGVIDRREEHFLFDGQWLTTLNQNGKRVIRRQIARKGERIDPFELGKGPFPLPFGQKRAEMLKQFEITLSPFALGDPLQTKHLHCVPRANTELARKYSRVEIYVDARLDLPVRIVTERISDDNRIEVDFKEIDMNEAPAGSRFQIKVPKGYDVTEEPLPAKSGVARSGARGG